MVFRSLTRLKEQGTRDLNGNFLALLSKHIITMFLKSRGSNVNLSLVSEILGDLVIFYKRQLGTFAQVSKWYLLIYIKCSF